MEKKKLDLQKIINLTIKVEFCINLGKKNSIQFSDMCLKNHSEIRQNYKYGAAVS